MSRTDIQPKKYRPSAVWTLTGNESDKPSYADSVASSTKFDEFQPLRSSDPKVPTIRTTLSSDDVSTKSQVPANVCEPITVNDRTITQSIIRPVRRAPPDREPAKEPRKFHLAKSSLSVSSPYLVSKTPAQKHRKSRRRELAVFVERTRELRKSRPTRKAEVLRDGSIPELHQGEGNDIVTSEVDRKVPNATPAERKWRAENWDKCGVHARSTEPGIRTGNDVTDPSHQWDYGSSQLAEQLQQIAFQETRAADQRSNQLASVPHLKTKPKPPMPRQSAAQRDVQQSDTDDVMADSVAPNDENDYIFDTYVRSHVYAGDMSDSHKPLTVPFQDIDHLNMGILVIEGDEVEELWETLGEDFDSDPEFNSEEEDENGMWPLRGFHIQDKLIDAGEQRRISMVMTIPKMKSTPTMSLVEVLTIIDMVQMMKNSMKRSPTGPTKRLFRKALVCLIESTSVLGSSTAILIGINYKR